MTLQHTLAHELNLHLYNLRQSVEDRGDMIEENYKNKKQFINIYKQLVYKLVGTTYIHAQAACKQATDNTYNILAAV